jgi:hypothetical protein
VDPVPDLPLLRKSGIVGNQTRDLLHCSHEIEPLGHKDSTHGIASSIISKTVKPAKIIRKNFAMSSH